MDNLLTIAVTYKFPQKDLKRFLQSLKENGVDKKNLIIIDNTTKNRGYAGAINVVLKENLEKYQYFLILNPDIKLHKNAINKMVAILGSDKSIGIVGPKILDASGKVWAIGGEINKKRYSGGLIGYGEIHKNNSTNSRKVDFISGTAMLVRREVFEQIGFLRDDYFLYYEDVDFSLRTKNAGFKLVIAPMAIITHFASSTIGKNSPMQQYYMARNHLYLVEHFAPLSIKLRELVRMPKTLWQARNNRFELLGIRDYFLRRRRSHDYWS